MEHRLTPRNNSLPCRTKVLGWKLGAILLFMCSGFLLPAIAQSGRRTQEDRRKQGEKADIRIETREVRLPIRAYSSIGKPVNDLAPKDIVIIENGQARQTTSIKLEQANILLVLDLSNEIGTYKNGESDRNSIFSDFHDYEKIEPDDMIRPRSRPLFEEPAAREFAYSLVDKLASTDRIAILQYSDKVQLIQDWTSDRVKAREALRSKFRMGIRSHYFDALLLASQKMNECRAGRRVIVLVSDGLDSASRTTQARAMEALLKSEASIFVVSWTELLRSEIIRTIKWYGAHEANNIPNYKRQRELAAFIRTLDAPETELKRLAEVTGGEFYLPTRFKFFVRAPEEIMRDIGAQYTLTYLTEREFVDADFRSVQVLGARYGITVKSRQRRYSE